VNWKVGAAENLEIHQANPNWLVLQIQGDIFCNSLICMHLPL